MVMHNHHSDQILNLPSISPRQQLSQCKKSQLKLSVLQELSSAYQGQAASGFIPFISERDGMGRLIRTPGVAEYLSTTPSPKALHKSGTLLRYELAKKPHLRRKLRLQDLAPPVGTYTLGTQWIKPSFRRPTLKKRNYESLREEYCASLPLSTENNDSPFLQRISLLDDLTESEKLWVKNQFAALELHGTPTELLSNLNFQRFRSLRDDVLQKFKATQRQVLEKWLKHS